MKVLLGAAMLWVVCITPSEPGGEVSGRCPLRNLAPADLKKDVEREACEFGQGLVAARVGPVAGGPDKARSPAATGHCTHSHVELFPHRNSIPLGGCRRYKGEGGRLEQAAIV